MAATKFSVITTGDKPSFHICVKELPGVHTYKVAVTVAKALMQEIEGEQIIAVVESWKLYPNENAWDEYIYWQTQDKKILKRINTLIRECQRTHLS